MSNERIEFGRLPSDYFGSTEHMRWLYAYFSKQLDYNRLSQMRISSWQYRNEPEANKERNLGVLLNIEANLEKIIKQLSKVI